MGVACSTYCLDCNIAAPEIGDQGMMGQPNLTDEKFANEDWGITTYNFGWFHAGLKAISLRPYTVEAYCAFLEAHQGHRVELSTDHDDESPHLDWDQLERYPFDGDGFVRAYYELTCPQTGETVTTSYKENFKIFEARTLTSAEIALALSKLIDSPDCADAFHNPPACVDPYDDLGRIGAFLKAHQDQPIVARLVT
ncbi:MAG: hypothetical protein QNJ22_09750 [Desulfosarcinaceae bacterium]|nr:hypothetical protein [Desulfosarcinaceae bacterium]